MSLVGVWRKWLKINVLETASQNGKVAVVAQTKGPSGLVGSPSASRNE